MRKLEVFSLKEADSKEYNISLELPCELICRISNSGIFSEFNGIVLPAYLGQLQTRASMQSTDQPAAAPQKDNEGSPAAFNSEQHPPQLGLKLGSHGALATTVAFGTGLALGFSHGSTKAAFRFRAENAHRFPTSAAGWYQYHKSKNYVSMLGGLKDGFKLGAKLSVGVMGFCFLEEIVNQARPGHRDFLSTVTAGLTFSGIYSLLARHDVYTAARTAKLGLKLSLAYGLAQDVLSAAKGDKPGYIAWVSKKLRGSDAENGAV
ncbi:hypothetical protein PRK78_004393 [Emydomyces testavorans]|uniref:Uncharacterized protein n=1 Tax=Emydomyces testavorans TaxID=2070801 RepID=A0AAF0DLF6_9EURO|nr:hypothetical protein PRK78_004393 [Emydomyces testavorans]